MRLIDLAVGAEIQVALPKGKSLRLVSQRFPFMQVSILQPGWTPVVLTGPDGAFRVRGIAPGRLTLRFEHPALGRFTKEVKVADEGMTKLLVKRSEFKKSVSDLVAVPLFAAQGVQVLRIDGIPVSRTTFEELKKFVRARFDEYAIPESVVARHAVEGILIPLASSFARHKKRVRELVKIQKRLLKGSTESLESMGKTLGAIVEDRRTKGVTRRELDAWIGMKVFQTQKGDRSAPFFSAKGLHVLEISNVTGQDNQERRQYLLLTWPYRPGVPADQFDAHLKEIAKRAQVEILDKKLSGTVPMMNAR